MSDFDNGKKWITANLTGLLAFIAGLILLGVTYRIILNIVSFSLGVILIYVGLSKLKVHIIIDFIDKMLGKLKDSLK
ncbi:MAG: hypothetical protein SZ59_C0002G0022 [candidate division TM6 bacterium GW2011_GWF2_28_16]|nr:MAG: hypothetical protein SZ59_C0002G0022 [candidate division TM6 bacterium GW2011_GWF2_28_16]